MTEGRQRNNRASLLQAAFDLFLEKDFDGVTVRDITARAGVAVGTFYNYFVDKEAVFRALVDAQATRASTAVRDFRRRAADGEQFIRFAYEAWFRGIAEHPEVFRVALNNEAVIGSLYRVPVAEMARGWLLEDIGAAVERGWFPPVDREHLAAAFIGVAQEMARIMIRRDTMDPGLAARFATGLFLGGLEALPRNE